MKKDVHILTRALIEVFKGRWLLKNIIKDFSIDMGMDFIVLIPKGFDESNYYVLLYLNKFIENLEKRKNYLEQIGFPVLRRNEKFLIITDDNLIHKSAKIICRRINDIKLLSTKNINSLLRYYQFYPCSDRLIIGMLDGIPGRTGYTALKCNGYSTEYLVANGIFHFELMNLNRKNRPKIPKYNGNDKEIICFIEDNDQRIQNEGNKRKNRKVN